MSEPRAPITLYRTEHEQLTLDSLAACTGVHQALITYFVEYGLLSPAPARAHSSFLTRLALHGCVRSNGSDVTWGRIWLALR